MATLPLRKMSKPLPESKTCPHCKIHKPASAFCVIDKGRRLDGWCRACKNEKNKRDRHAWRETHPRKHRILSDMLTGDGLMICARCKEPKPPDFYPKRGTWCKPCRAEYEAERRRKRGIEQAKRSRIENGQKLCTKCNQFFPLDGFYKAQKGIGGVMSHCKTCVGTRNVENRERARRHTQEWRQRHRERYLAQHRVHQFNRKTKQKIQGDGTLTDEFLKSLYATDVCFYCQSQTLPDKRTLDHKIPLSRGGAHSVENAVMACWTCNCSKADATDSEFIAKLNSRQAAA